MTYRPRTSSSVRSLALVSSVLNKGRNVASAWSITLRFASISAKSLSAAAGLALTINSRLTRALARVVTSMVDMALALVQVSWVMVRLICPMCVSSYWDTPARASNRASTTPKPSASRAPMEKLPKLMRRIVMGFYSQGSISSHYHAMGPLPHGNFTEHRTRENPSLDSTTQFARFS
ncbi:hypothetical protein D3C71_1289240 [compost metagenome]